MNDAICRKANDIDCVARDTALVHALAGVLRKMNGHNVLPFPLRQRDVCRGAERRLASVQEVREDRAVGADAPFRGKQTRSNVSGCSQPLTCRDREANIAGAYPNSACQPIDLSKMREGRYF